MVKKLLINGILISASIVLHCYQVEAQVERVIIAGWHFNDDPSGSSISSDVGNGTIYIDGTNGSDSGWNIDFFSGTSINSDGITTTNGDAFCPSDDVNNGKHMVFKFSMLNRDSLKISFARRGTSTGYNSGTWEYSVDGLNWQILPGAGNSATQSTSYSLYTIYTSVLDNTFNAYVRYTLDGATTGNGNNRIDNFKIEAEDNAPAAIRIADISALNKGNTNIISWETLSEDASDVYIIEKSVNGSDFIPYQLINATGIAPQAYQVTDILPFEGITYYRIRMENNNGTVNYSKTVKATYNSGNNRSGKLNLSIFPNPAHQDIHIRINGLINPGTELLVTDYSGRIISRQAIATSGAFIYNGYSLKPGVYYFTVISGSKQQSVKVIRL